MTLLIPITTNLRIPDYSSDNLHLYKVVNVPTSSSLEDSLSAQILNIVGPADSAGASRAQFSENKPTTFSTRVSSTSKGAEDSKC